MKHVVHGSKERLKALACMIAGGVSPDRSLHEVSGVRGDGTVTVRFRSGRPGDSASELCLRFVGLLVGRGLAHEVVGVDRVRMPLPEAC